MYNITCNTDDYYAQHCAAMLCSLFDNNKDEDITVHILCNTLSEKYRDSLSDIAKSYGKTICFYNVNESPLEGVQFRVQRPLTKAAYYRLLLSSILSDIDKVLYLDCDMIVLGKIKELFDLKIEKYSLAAVIDPMPYNEDHQTQLSLSVDAHCFCSGIMLVNLKYWRDHNIEAKLLTFAKQKRKPIYLHDQDVLNYVLHKQWFMLSPKWNYNPVGITYTPFYKSYHYADMVFTPAIIHYCSEYFKPWYKAPCPGREYYDRYLKLSKFQYVRYVRLPLGRYIYCHYYYVRRMLMKIRPLMPKTIVVLVTDIINIIRLLAYFLLYIFSSKEKFQSRIKNFYESDRINP